MAQPAKREDKALEVHGTALRRAAVESGHDWERFLRNLAAPHGALSPQTVRQVLDLWQAIEQAGGDVPPPFAAATEAGGLSMTWDRGRHHFEVEVLSHGAYDWFYMDRDSDERAGAEDMVPGSCTPEMLSYLWRALGTHGGAGEGDRFPPRDH
jgi:hypothetical protein